MLKNKFYTFILNTFPCFTIEVPTLEISLFLICNKILLYCGMDISNQNSESSVQGGE